MFMFTTKYLDLFVYFCCTSSPVFPQEPPNLWGRYGRQQEAAAAAERKANMASLTGTVTEAPTSGGLQPTDFAFPCCLQVGI